MASTPDLTRPSWHTWFMRLAYVVAQRGSCRRKRVGCVIVDQHHRIVATGYNGAPRRLPDCLEVGCDVRTIDGRESCVRTLHAESNAIDYAGNNANRCVIFTTVIPCRICAQRIVQAGAWCVVYHEFYRSQGTDETLAVLQAGDIELVHLDLPQHELVGVYEPPT